MSDFGISFGALSPKLWDQLKEQGLRIPAYVARSLQKRMDACVDLKVTGFLSDSEATKVHQRLIKTIRREIEKEMKK